MMWKKLVSSFRFILAVILLALGAVVPVFADGPRTLSDSGGNSSSVLATGSISLQVNPGLYGITSGMPVVVNTVGMPPANGVQVKILHSANVALVDVRCVGAFGSSFTVLYSKQQDGTLIGCVLLAGFATGDGPILQFQAVPQTRMSSFEVSIGALAQLGTIFSNNGDTVGPSTVSFVVTRAYVRGSLIYVR